MARPPGVPWKAKEQAVQKAKSFDSGSAKQSLTTEDIER
jgi:hypothetical protein